MTQAEVNKTLIVKSCIENYELLKRITTKAYNRHFLFSHRKVMPFHGAW